VAFGHHSSPSPINLADIGAGGAVEQLVQIGWYLICLKQVYLLRKAPETVKTVV
jgi:hypothetical protein